MVGTIVSLILLKSCPPYLIMSINTRYASWIFISWSTILSRLSRISATLIFWFMAWTRMLHWLGPCPLCVTLETSTYIEKFLVWVFLPCNTLFLPSVQTILGKAPVPCLYARSTKRLWRRTAVCWVPSLCHAGLLILPILYSRECQSFAPCFPNLLS